MPAAESIFSTATFILDPTPPQHPFIHTRLYTRPASVQRDEQHAVCLHIVDRHRGAENARDRLQSTNA